MSTFKFPVIFSSKKVAASLITVPYLNISTIFTSTFTKNRPNEAIATMHQPIERIFFGLFLTTKENLFIYNSIKLGFVIDLEFGFHFINEIIAGKNVKDNKHAQNIPKAIVIPYPFMPSIGEKSNDRNASIVVIEVRIIGIQICLHVSAIALILFFECLNSLKNLLMICTPSEFAIVNNSIGIDALLSVK